MSSSIFKARAAASVARSIWVWKAGFVEFQRTAIRRACGTTSFSSSRDLPAVSADTEEFPVTLPPGRASVATRCAPTGSATPAMTMGVVLVAPWAAREAWVTTATGCPRGD